MDYKNPNYCRVDEIDGEIKKRESELQILQKRKDFYARNSIIRFAEFLHQKLCTHNHTDGCGWHYETWENVDKSHARKRYLKMAGVLLDILPAMKKLEDIIIAIKQHR